MGKSSPRPPQIINPGASAATQATFNVEAAQQQRALNMMNQETPQGSIRFEPTGEETLGIPGYKAVQELSPTQQSLYDLGNVAAQRYGEIGTSQLENVAEKFETPFSVAGLGPPPAVNEATRTASRDAIIARLQPQMDRDRGILETSLINRGFAPESVGYDTQLDQANRARNDMYLAADARAGAEMAQQYGLEANVRDRAINEELMQRNIPLNELAALMGGAAPQAPSFVPTPQGAIAAPDFMGAEFGAANQAQNRYNQQMAMNREHLGGLYGLGAAGAQAAGWKWGS
jgi:hypothetical protein